MFCVKPTYHILTTNVFILQYRNHTRQSYNPTAPLQGRNGIEVLVLLVEADVCGDVCTCNVHNELEGAWLIEGEGGHHLAVDRKVGARDAVHEDAVRKPLLTHGRTNAADPQL